MSERTQETLLAAITSLIAEGIAVLLFMAMIFVWIAIYLKKMPELPI